MLAVYLSPFYLIFHMYICHRLIKWLRACHPFFHRKWLRVLIVAVCFSLGLTIPAGALLPQGMAKRVVTLIGNYWLGFNLYTALVVLLADALRLILLHSKHVDQKKLHAWITKLFFGLIGTLLILGTGIYGMINAKIIRVTPYEIEVHKKAGDLDELNVVLAADLHMGYNIGVSHIRQMVQKINAQEPDLVVLAGDIFDNNYDALEDPQELIHILSEIQSRYGTYACYGNHDIDETIVAGFTFKGGEKQKKASDPRMDEFLQSAGIRLLRDEAVLIDNCFYLYGRPDAQRVGRGITQRKTPAEITKDLDKEKPILVIDHQPRELAELAEAGVDVDLCGHTHDGQMFPLNLTCRLIWENSCGYLKKGDMHNIVTSGVGLFGPNMRVATVPEICPITIRFTG